MSKLLCNAFKLTSALLSVTLLLPNRTLAESTPAPDSLEQVTSVSQLSDVQTTSWAFQALQSLVERYGCIAGYPNGTYRGNRAMTRYEFAAGLNACLDRVQELISTSTSDAVTKEDLAKLQRLQEEFSAELVTLRGRVDTLEASNAQLEANQFSTTTKLNGDVIFVVADVFGGLRAVPSSATTAGGATPAAGSAGKLNVNPTLSYRVRLNFDTSFTGKDLLRTRLIAANNTPLDTNVTGTNMTRLGFDANTNSSVGLSRLWYRFPLGKNGSAKIALVDTYFEDNVFTFNPLLSPSISGSVSRFGRFNPIYRQGVNNADESTGGAGLTVNYNLNKVLGLSVGYLAPSSSAGNPLPSLGLFNGSYAAIGQLSLRPSDAVNIGLTYVHAYNNPVNGISVSGDTGSVFANRPFGDVATSTNQYAVEALFRLNPKINISGWAGWTYATAEVSNNQGVSRGDRAHIFNYAVALSFPDLGKAGNLGAIIFGQPPRVTSNDFGNGLERTDRDISYHLEALFRYRLNDNIDITPAVIAVFNPEHNNNNDTEFVGAVRTSFRF